MSDLPKFLPKSAPLKSIVDTSGQLSGDETLNLQNQINTLHFRPTVVVLDYHYHVQDGNALVGQLAETWSLGPHGMIVMYSPADKEIWSVCGKFNSSAGVDPSFFKHDFSQRMGMGNRDGSLSAALNASLQDVDSVVVRSQSAATQAVTHPGERLQAVGDDGVAVHRGVTAGITKVPANVVTRIGTTTGTTTGTITQGAHHHRHHVKSTGTQSAASLGSVFQAMFMAVILLIFFAKVLKQAAPREKFDDIPPGNQGLSSDVERILRVMQTQHGSGTAGGGAVRPRNTQVPMAEFQKRAGAGQSRAGTGVSNNAPLVQKSSSSIYSPGASETDHAASLQSAIDRSAAQVREEHKRKVADGVIAPPSMPKEAIPVVQDGEFIESYVASFSSGGSNDSSAKSSKASSPAAKSNSAPVVMSASVVMPAVAETTAPVTPPVINTNTPVIMPAVAGYSSGSAPGGSLDLKPFSLEAASAPFADVLSSMGSTLGDMKTNAGGSLPLGSLSSFDASSNGSGGPATACPNCTEPKLKDFSFCLKCGHNF